MLPKKLILPVQDVGFIYHFSSIMPLYEDSSYLRCYFLFFINTLFVLTSYICMHLGLLHTAIYIIFFVLDESYSYNLCHSIT